MDEAAAPWKSALASSRLASTPGDAPGSRTISRAASAPSPLGPPQRVVAAAAAAGGPEKHEKAREVLREVLRCAYDCDAWSAESARLEAAKEGDLLACVDRMDHILASRTALFATLREQMGTFRKKLVAKGIE